MKKILMIILLLLVCTGLTFAAPSVLVYGTTEKVTDMDTAHAYDFHTWEIFQNVYRGLMLYKPGTTELTMGLAESYSVNATGDAFTFKLRKGVRFTDGTPFNAQTVKWSIDRVAALKGDPSWLVTDYVKSVDRVDDYTVRFNLNFPCAFFPALVATVPYQPLNPNVYPVDKIVRDPSELKGGAIVGLGPYKIISFKRDEEVILEINKDYYGKKPNIDRIVIRYFADATTMRLALEKGEVDLVFKTLNPSDITDLEKKTNFTAYKMSGP
ncbi:MAG: ABC transporter substrate-binding protein, partial [Spirochaetota bacterium]